MEFLSNLAWLGELSIKPWPQNPHEWQGVRAGLIDHEHR